MGRSMEMGKHDPKKEKERSEERPKKGEENRR